MKQDLGFGHLPIYHAINKSIEKFTIFRNEMEYNRFLLALEYYKYGKQKIKFSKYLEKIKKGKTPEIDKTKQLVSIYAYCIMPTHYHLLLEELIEKGLESFMHLFETSYAVAFNRKYRRKGHLWQNSYKKVLIKSNNQFLKTSRYIHMNPCKSKLVSMPSKWPYSSYMNFISNKKNILLDSPFKYLSCSKKEYKDFIESNMKDLLSENI